MKEIELVKKSYDELQDLVIQLNTDKFILQSRIDKAKEYIKTHSEMTNLQIYGIENVLAFRGSTTKLLEILGEKEIEEIPLFEGTLEQLNNLSILEDKGEDK